MNNYPDNIKNTLTYENIQSTGYQPDIPEDSLSYWRTNIKKHRSSVVLMLIDELILTSSLITLIFLDGIWVILPYVLFLVFLFTALFSSIERSLKPIVIMTVLIAVICGGIYEARINLPFFFENISNNIIYFMINISVLCIGSGLIIYTFVNSGSYKKFCTTPVNGRVIDYKKSVQYFRGGSTVVYCPEYEYYYNGRKYRSYDGRYYKFLNPPIGEVRTIYIYPENPMTFREPKRTAALSRRRVFYGISFVLIGMMLIVAYGFMG